MDCEKEADSTNFDFWFSKSFFHAIGRFFRWWVRKAASSSLALKSLDSMCPAFGIQEDHETVVKLYTPLALLFLPKIMEVETGYIWKVTSIGGTHFWLPWLWEEVCCHRDPYDSLVIGRFP